MANLDEAFRYDKAQKSQSAFGQLSLFGGEEESMLGEFEMKNADPFPFLEKLKMEKELLGFYISGHPLDSYEKEIRECVKVNVSDPDTIVLGQDTQIIGQIIAQKVVISKKSGGKLLFLTIQTQDGDVEAAVFTKVYEKIEGKTEVDGIYGFKGRFDKRDDKLSFVVSDIVEPSELEPLAVQRFNIRIKANVEINRMTMKELMEVMIQNEGSVPVSLFISDIPGEELKLKSTSSVQSSQNLYNEIKALEVVEKAWVS